MPDAANGVLVRTGAFLGGEGARIGRTLATNLEPELAGLQSAAAVGIIGLC